MTSLMITHLKSRYLDKDLYPNLVITDKIVTFYLYNMSGQIIGYQTYNPTALKNGHKDTGNPELSKYVNRITRFGKSAELAVWGLETVNWLTNIVFLTEGIFDAARLHFHGIPALAVLCNNPKHLRSWINTLPWKTISCIQGDKSGRKLGKYSNYFNVVLPTNKDVGDLSEKEFSFYFKEWIK